MKYVSPRMPTDPGELMNFWDTCENLWNLYEVPDQIRAKLLLPLLTPKAKVLISRLDATALADVKQIKQFLLNEFHLTSREYRARFNAAGRGDETYALFTSRLKNLWEFYMRSRECKDFDKLTDLIVADRLKDTLSGPCLKYCLAMEGNKVLRSEEIAALADTFDANYTPDGRYQGGMVHSFREGKDNNAQYPKRGFGTEQPRTPPPHPVPPSVAQTQRERKGTPGGSVTQARSGPGGSNMQRKCWLCLSPFHLRKDCPEASKTSSIGHQQKPRVSACIVPEQSPVVSETETILKQVSFVTQSLGHVDYESDDTYVVNPHPKESLEPRENPVVVNTTHLTPVPLCVESEGPYKCLVDSGSELPIAKRAVVDELATAKSSSRQIRLQGIFSVPVTADLVTLHVSVQDKTRDDCNFDVIAVPIVFAVTDAMVQACDFILPLDAVHRLKIESNSVSSLSSLALS